MLLVGLGGLMGAVSRYATGRWLVAALPLPGYIATAIINTAGSLLLGLFVARAAATGADARWQIFLTVGFCGAFTTFSSWILDITKLAEQASWRWATGHVVASLALGLAGFALGMFLGRHMPNPQHVTTLAQRLATLKVKSKGRGSVPDFS